jgi:hypothetical protein
VAVTELSAIGSGDRRRPSTNGVVIDVAMQAR